MCRGGFRGSSRGRALTIQRGEQVEMIIFSLENRRRDAGATENKLRRVVSRKAVGKSEMSADEEFAGSNPLAALELHGFHTQGCPAAADHD